MASNSKPQTITCRGAVCWGKGEPMVVEEEVLVEPPAAGEARVRMLRASICHTDFLFLNGFPLELFPRIPGHEGVGVVESVGEGVTSLKEGDFVIPIFVGQCESCPNCASGRSNVCLTHPLRLDGLMADGTSRMSVKGRKLYHAFSCSTFCEFAVVDVEYVVKIDSRLPLPHASLLSCGFSTGYGAAWKEARVEKGAAVAVIGLGGVGMGAVAGAKLHGAAKIIGVDLNSARRAQAARLGMTDFINPKDLEEGKKKKTLSEAIKELTGGLGVDCSFECTGVSSLVNEATEATMPGKGIAVVIGVGEQRAVTVDIGQFIAGKTVKGSMFGGLRPLTDVPTIADKCISKELELDGMVTHEVDLSDINRAFEMLKLPECLKVVVRIGELEERVQEA